MVMKKRIASIASTALLIFSQASVAASDNCRAFSLEDGSMRIPIQIQGEEYPALMTTSNISAGISQGLVDELGLKERVNHSRRIVYSTGSDQPYRYVTDVPLSLFGIETNIEEMAIVRDSSSSISLSLRVFKGLLVQINFPEEQLCFLSRDSVDLRKNQNIDLSSSAERGTPAISVTLNNDMGTWLEFRPSLRGGILVDRLVVRTLGLEPKSTETNNESDYARSVVDSLTLGPYELGNIPVVFPKDGVQSNITERLQTLTGSNIHRNAPTRGSIGLDVLKHFVVTMDLELERAHIYAP